MPAYLLLIFTLIQLLSATLMKVWIYGQVDSPRTPTTPTWLNILAIVCGVATLLIIICGFVLMMLYRAIWGELFRPLFRAICPKSRQPKPKVDTEQVHGRER